MLITPEYVFKDVTHITPEFLAGKGIRALVLDIDNTLTADRSQELPDEVAGWLAQMKEAGIGLTIVSNGAEKRVRPFAEKLGLAYAGRPAEGGCAVRGTSVREGRSRHQHQYRRSGCRRPSPRPLGGSLPRVAGGDVWVQIELNLDIPTKNS